MRARAILLLVAALLAAGCAGEEDESAAVAPESTATTTAATIPPPTAAPTTSTPPTTTTVAPTTTTISPFARPDWLGTRLLPLREDGHGEVQPTPPELSDRRLETISLLPPPADDAYAATIGPVPDDVLARSSWTEACPVTADELAYLTISHWGFDGGHHTGELIVNAAVAEDVVEVFGRLHEARFPIEGTSVVTLEQVDDHPTGDWNDTTGFVCRPAVGSSNWSQHAFGLAVDINPFHNPYLKGDLVLPELASVYVDRERVLPGMIFDGDVVVRAFADIGWAWGGNWSSLKDWMHFSASGR
ncbi:MAG: M15 family metallopeptidase [Actinomycetota bacterium]